jgi:hypothetical protein
MNENMKLCYRILNKVDPGLFKSINVNRYGITLATNSTMIGEYLLTRRFKKTSFTNDGFPFDRFIRGKITIHIYQ